jgi:membrane protein YdbS with pleckstrin-like domain
VIYSPPEYRVDAHMSRFCRNSGWRLRMGEAGERPRRSWRMPELLIAALYLLSFILVLVPYYNFLYRQAVLLLHAASFWLSPCVIVLVVIPHYLIERRFKRVLLAIAVGLLIVLADWRVQSWRYHITERYLKSHYCGASKPVEDDAILGGIVRMRIDRTER